MARRRSPEPVAEEEDPYGLPEPLRRCVVEHWIDPRVESPGPEYAFRTVETTVDGWALVVARGRFVRARLEWEKVHDLEPGTLTRSYGACGRPTFQDRSAFLAAITARGTRHR